MLLRLQTIISRAGITSRRKAEELIQDGSVTVNGKTIQKLGSKADPQKDHIKVNGRLIQTRQPKAYLILHKPRGVVTTLSDPQGRPTVKDLLEGVRTRVFPVGRLDYDSEGLLLLTNDGELTHQLLHPRYEVPRTYQVKVDGLLSEDELEKLRKGVILPGGRLGRCEVKKFRKTDSNSWLQIVLFEGQKRQIRRMIEKLGHSVMRLKRTRLATLELGNLELGRYRALDIKEIESLKAFIRRRHLSVRQAETAAKASKKNQSIAKVIRA